MDVRKRLRKDFAKAEELKAQVKGRINEILGYTEDYGTLDEHQPTAGSKRDIDPVISDSLDSISNFVMYTIFGIKSKWARWGVTEHLLKKKFGDMDTETLKEQLQVALDDTTDTTFKYLFDSNYYTEVAKSVRDANNIGTGCYKLIEIRNNARPFRYEYIHLSNLYLLNDTFKRPNYVFEKKIGLNAEAILDMYPTATLPPDVSENNPQRKIDVIEVVRPEFDQEKGEMIYHHSAWTVGFKHELFSTTLSYNPYVVYRFQVIKDTPWGKGLGHVALKSFKELEYYKLMRSRQVRKITDPSIGLIGDKALMYKMSLEAGVINYLGDGTNTAVDARNIGVTGNLMPIDVDIQTVKQEIRDIYMAKPFGDMEEMQGSKSTLEIEKRFQLFRQRYSGTAELFYTELLKPTFLAPYNILVKRKIISMPEGVESVTYLRLINNLTKSAQMEDVENLVQFNMIIRESFPTYSQFVFKPSKIIWEVADKMEINPELLNSMKEIEEKYQQEEQRQMMVAQAQAQAEAMKNNPQGGNEGGNPTGTNEGAIL